MKLKKRKIKKQLFICCNQRPAPKACCGETTKGATQLVANIKAQLLQQGLWDEFKVTKSGCLGPCTEGVCGLLFPDNILLTELSSTDESELLEILTKS